MELELAAAQLKMMATRNPKVKPAKRKSSNPAARPRESTSSKEQAWTDTDDTEMTKESDTTKEEGETSDNLKGSVISVREADDSNKTDTIEKEPEMAPSTAPSENGAVEPPMTTDTEVPNGTESDSLASLESATRRRIKRNQIVPTDGEDSGRQTPDSEVRRDAWSEVDADEESNAASSRPGSAPAFRQASRSRSARPRPVTAGVARARDTRPIERPLPVSVPGPATSTQAEISDQPTSGQLAITNGVSPMKYYLNVH